MAEIRKQKCVEDAVEYRIFPYIPDCITPAETPKYLEDQLEAYLIHFSNVLVKYIWQNEPFQLTVIPGTGSVPAHLFGNTKFGDNVEDEWFIVKLLMQISSNFKHTVIQVNDNDGEFLLVEAADDLPKWLDPDTSQNRVFIYDGNLHIIPRKENISNTKEAIMCIRQKFQVTKAAAKVQRHIAKRIEGYPEKAESSIHYAHCYIPASLAAVLDVQPNLVAPIVQAFYYRDPLDLKACITFQHFRPGTRVMRRVKFTRCLYAQLQQQHFEADKRSGYIMPSTSNRQYRAHVLGMKLAHGAEILCSKCDYNGQVPSQHPRWQKFLASLSEKGYFKGEMEGSQLYCKLLEDARNFYTASVSQQNSKKYGPGEKIMHLAKVTNYNLEEMRKEEQTLPPSDDDSWLELSPEQLESMMQDKFGDAFQSNNSLDLEQVVGSMKSFISKTSSHEGAEFPKEEGSDEVQFDPNSFVHTMQKMFDFQDEDKSSSDDMSEYGSDDEPEDSLSPTGSATTTLSGHSSVSQQSQASRGPQQPSGDTRGGEPSIQDYMELMDQELAKTTISESFVKDNKPERPVPPPRRKKKSPTEPHPSSTTTPSQADPSASKPKQSAPLNNAATGGKRAPRAMSDDIDDLDEDFQPVNVDLNLVHNLLESYGAQDGLAGPTSNILGSMGVQLPPPRDTGTSDDHLD